VTSGALHRVDRGDGPDLVLVHGSASDADGWTSLFSTHGDRLHLWAYDRRGTDRSPLPAGRTSYSVAEHAEDLRAVLDEAVGRPAVVCGASFGAVVALHAARRDPGWFRGLVLIEPPLPAHDRAPPIPDDFMDEVLRLRDQVSGDAAARYFLERVLGPAGLRRMRPRWVERCAAMSAQIILDCQALQDYRPRYAQLSKLEVPTLLVGGADSVGDFPPALAALADALPDPRRVTIPDAGHMVHADAPGPFGAELMRFIDSLPPSRSG
jgi:pimeloyl-ACP methyl ester carboxylesterase